MTKRKPESWKSCFIAACLMLSWWLPATAQETSQPAAQDETRQSGSTRLALAIRSGDVTSVEKALTDGVSVTEKTAIGITPYQLAMLRGYPTIADQLAAAGAPRDQPPNLPAVADAILDRIEADKSPALALLVARDGKVVYRRVLGMANVEQGTPADNQSKFRIGSVTKQFTAAAVLKLVERNKLSLDDTLDKFMPDFPRGDEITIHQLLTHTSGIPSFTDNPKFWERVTQPTSEEDQIATFRQLPLSFEPGTQFHYNNSGYFLLGHLVKKISGQSLGEFLAETFFQPLQMTDTGIHSPDLKLKNETIGYAFEGGTVTPALNWHMSQAGGAGALYSTIDDLMLWNEAVFTGKVLSRSLLERAHTPHHERYGYGWVIGTHRGLKSIGHSGGLQGFVSDLVRYPDQNLTIIALHNAFPSNPQMVPSVVTREFAELFLWDEMQPRVIHEVASNVSAGTLARYVGRYDYHSAIMAITNDNDRLFAQLTGQPKFEIFPSSDTEFFWKAVEASVVFVVDAEGQCTAVKHSQNGQTFVAKRLPNHVVVELPNETLDRYVGLFDYGAAKMTIRREGNQLIAKLGPQPGFPIYPENETTFHWQVVEATISFTVDDSGTVTGATHKQSGTEFQVKKVTETALQDEP